MCIIECTQSAMPAFRPPAGLPASGPVPIEPGNVNDAFLLQSWGAAKISQSEVADGLLGLAGSQTVEVSCVTSPTITVLVIDDEPQIRRAVRRAVAAVPAETLEAATGAMGIDVAASARPDAIILDLGLPDTTGLAVCQEIRRWSRVPVIVLSARHAEAEKVELLNAGADDYVTKPFGMEELAARVRAQLRRAQNELTPESTKTVSVGTLRIDLASRTVTRDGNPVRLTPIEWDLLRTFVTNRGRTLTHQQLFDAVWRRSHGDARLYLRVHLTNLRRKIEPNPAAPELILTESGVGYRFAGEGTS
jgi:two-component system KDP operon response regulator KdpE